jgi:hypothetical protein
MLRTVAGYPPPELNPPNGSRQHPISPENPTHLASTKFSR